MTILSEIWEEWVTPEMLITAGMCVGIAPTGLNVDKRNQEKFKTAEAILNPTKTPEKKAPIPDIPSPANVRKGSAEYYKYKYEKSLEINQTVINMPVALEKIPSLLSYNKIKPNKSKNLRITNQHGSLSVRRRGCSKTTAKRSG